MKDEEINIAIAEACGITVYDERSDYGFVTKTGKVCRVPDYCHDLNAMHEAEKCFDSQPMDEQSKYLDYLYCEVGWDDANNAAHAKHKCYYGSVRATARQRAEAFLRVKGLWKSDDTKP